jgi:hypothetical protein
MASWLSLPLDRGLGVVGKAVEQANARAPPSGGMMSLAGRWIR